MAALKHITASGQYNELVLQGAGEITLDGVIIDAPGQTVLIDRLQVSHVRYPLTVKRVGQLVIQDYVPHTFWGDTANFRCSHIHIGRLAPKNIIQRLKYEELHQDIIFQAFAVCDDGYTLDPSGVIEDIQIQEVDVCSPLDQVNGIMLSEVNQYRRFNIGQRRLHVGINAPYWLSGNSLQYSVVGGRDNLIFNPMGLVHQPTIRLQDVKGSQFKTQDVAFWDVPGAEHAIMDY